ncbi:unnamed protein product, partial [Didymodactylos carnosus]
GVYGRVFFTWCPSISELPKAKSKCFTNVASFSHLAYAVAYSFTNQFQFRHLNHLKAIPRKVLVCYPSVFGQ